MYISISTYIFMYIHKSLVYVYAYFLANKQHKSYASVYLKKIGYYCKRFVYVANVRPALVHGCSNKRQGFKKCFLSYSTCSRVSSFEWYPVKNWSAVRRSLVQILNIQIWSWMIWLILNEWFLPSTKLRREPKISKRDFICTSGSKLANIFRGCNIGCFSQGKRCWSTHQFAGATDT